MGELTLHPLKKIIRKAGAKRVSDGAASALGITLEKEATQLFKDAGKIAEHANRRTVLKKDIRLASRHSA